MKTTCPICGQDERETKHGTYSMEVPASIPGGAIEIHDATWEHCNACGEDFIADDLNKAIARVQYHRLGLLSPEQIRQVREKTGLSAVEMSQLLNAGDKSYTRWESGKSIHNKSTDTLIRLIDQHPELFAEINAQRDPERHSVVQDYFSNLGQFKGGNEFALAAHGESLNSADCEQLRERLLKLLALSEQQ